MRPAALVLAILTLAGCSREAPPRPPAVERTATAGGASLRVTLDRASATVVDELRLALELTADGPGTLTLQELSTELGGFTVRAIGAPVRERLPDSRQQLRREFTLTPFLAGEYTIPPLAGTFTPLGGQPVELRTPEIRVPIASVLENPESATLGEFREAPPRGGGRVWAWSAAGAGAVAIAGGTAAFAWSRRRRRSIHSADPMEQLRRAALGELPPEAALDACARVPVPHDSSVRQRLDRARFSGVETSAADAALLAAEVLRVAAPSAPPLAPGQTLGAAT